MYFYLKYKAELQKYLANGLLKITEWKVFSIKKYQGKIQKS